MLYTISQYNPNNPSDPITKAWDDTQSQVTDTHFIYVGRILKYYQLFSW